MTSWRITLMSCFNRRTTITLVSASVSLGLLTADIRTAHALQGGEDPALLPVLIDKRFGNDGVHQVSAQFSTAMATKFIEGTGGYLSYGYNFTDLLGIEIGGAFIAGSESKIMSQVRIQFPNQEPPLSDLYQLQWMANANFVLVPLYGKMSFASEFDPGYDLFLTVGAGAGGVRRQIGQDDVRTYDSKVAPIINFGVGLRFYFTRMIALRLELRDFFFPEPDSAKGGLTFNLHFQGGLQFNFGGNS